MDAFFTSGSLGHVMHPGMAHPSPDEDQPGLDNWGRPTFRAVEDESQTQANNEENERRGNRNHPDRENLVPSWFRPNTQPLENYNRRSKPRQNITHLDHDEKDVLYWFARHGRTVQAPEQNVYQMTNMDIHRSSETMSRVVYWFRVINYFRTRNSRAVIIDGEVRALPNEAWQEDPAEYDNIQWTDVNDEFYDPTYENENRPAPQMDADMDWGSDSGYDTEEPPFDPIFVNNNGNGNGDSNNSSDEELVDWTPPMRPSHIDFGLNLFRRTITPDERIIFNYFLRHPELTQLPSAHEYREMHLAGTAHHDPNHYNNEHIQGKCPFGPEDWEWCYGLKVMRLYARREQEAINCFVGLNDPEDDDRMDKEFLEFLRAPHDDDRFRRTPNLRQWRTAPNEGRHGWVQFSWTAFRIGIIPLLEGEELKMADMAEEE